jgi:hypothetical protein
MPASIETTNTRRREASEDDPRRSSWPLDGIQHSRVAGARRDFDDAVVEPAGNRKPSDRDPQ